MEQDDLLMAIEAVLFAAGEPLSVAELKRVFTQYWLDEPEEARAALLEQVPTALAAVEARWRDDNRGFYLVEVAEGWAFRTRSQVAPVLRAMHKEKPQRLSKPALETLAIVAYRQPVTKPEADHIRGVDCGGTLKVLLDRNLVRIVGKSEDVGRPLLYGTTKDFLSLFTLGDLSQLPSLREVQELSAEAQEELAKAEVLPSLKELAETAHALRDNQEPAVATLDEAVQALETTEQTARDAFMTQGMALRPGDVPAVEVPAADVPSPPPSGEARIDEA